MSYADLEIGVPAMLICLEMVPLSLFFLYAYTWRPYIIGSPHQLAAVAHRDENDYYHHPQSYVGGPLGIRALIEMWNPMEILEAIRFGFRMEVERRRGRVVAQEGVYESVDSDLHMGVYK